MWQKLILLLIYLSFYIVILRSWDWLYYDLLADVTVPSFVDPLTLNARQLRAMLDSRGVFYTGFVEKRELVQLITQSGGVNTADTRVHDNQLHSAKYANHRPESSQHGPSQTAGEGTNGRRLLESEVQEFTGGSHFNEQVEDCKDSAWIVQVVSRNHPPVMNEYLWLRLIKTLSPFGIRFGMFECGLDYRMCQIRQWNTSRLLLALPHDGNQAKSAVITYTYDGGINAIRYQPLMEWIHNRVGRRVSRLNTRFELMTWMNQSCEPTANVCFLLVTSLTLPPFFISALSVKFNGRVKFGMAGHEAAVGFGDEDEEAEGDAESESETVGQAGIQRNGPRRLSATAGRYMIISPQESSTTTYGGSHHRREPLTYSSLHSFLKWITPDLNDVFVLSIAFTNLLALLTLFECRGQPFRIMSYFVWTAFKYNLYLLLLWACFLSVINFKLVIDFCQLASSTLRRFSFTRFGRSLIDDWLEIRRQIFNGFHARYAGIASFLVTFLGFNALIHYARRKFGFLGGLRQLDEIWLSDQPNLDNTGFRGDWFIPPSIANGLRFAPTGVTTLWGGIGWGGSSDIEGSRRLYRFDDPNSDRLDMDPKLEALIRSLSIRDVCLDPRVPYAYILDLPIFQHEEIYKPTDPNVQSCSESIEQKVQSCPVCLDTYKNGDTLCVLPCDHDFHHRCILSWLFQDQPTCPCCRQPANVERKLKIS